MDLSWSILSALVAAVPFSIIVFSVVVGSKQAREFHRRTGDSSLLAHIAALSTFPEDKKGPPPPEDDEARRDTHREAHAA